MEANATTLLICVSIVLLIWIVGTIFFWRVSRQNPLPMLIVGAILLAGPIRLPPTDPDRVVENRTAIAIAWSLGLSALTIGGIGIYRDHKKKSVSDKDQPDDT